MPRTPPLLTVEVVYNEDEQSAREARLAALDLLISWVLEDRAEQQAGDSRQVDLIA